MVQNALLRIDSRMASDPMLFSMLVMCQGLLGGFGLIQVPERVLKFFSNPLSRFLIISCISYTATKDARTALMSAAILLSVMHLLRTPEEKKQLGGLYL